MKKLFILALVALVAGAAFAETAPAFTGDFEYSTQFDFDLEAYNASASPDASINLNGVVDEWSTVNAEIGSTSITTAGEYIVDMTNAAAVQVAGDTITTTKQFITVAVGDDYIGNTYDIGDALSDDTTEAGVLQVNQFTLTTDITGALGVDGPVGVAITWGALTFQAEDYSGKAGYAEIEVPQESATYIGFELVFDIVEKAQVVVSVAPSTYTDWDGADEAVIGIELILAGLIEGLDVNVWYLTDMNEGFNQMGLTAGYESDMVDVGAAFAYDLEVETMGFGVAAKYKMDILEAGVAFSAAGLTDGVDFGDVAAIGLNVTFKAVPDTLDLFAAVNMPFLDLSDNLGFEGGLVFYLGATEYTLGYEHNSVNFNAPDNDPDAGLFFKVYAEF